MPSRALLLDLSSAHRPPDREDQHREGRALTHRPVLAFNPFSIARSGTRSARAKCARLSRLMDFLPRSTSPTNLPDSRPWPRGDPGSSRGAVAADGGRTRRGASTRRGGSFTSPAPRAAGTRRR
jgi:hypothetical protein